MLAIATLVPALLLPLPRARCVRPRPRCCCVVACASPAEKAAQAIQSGEARQIEEAMRSIIDLERMAGRSEEDIPNNPLLQELSAAQARSNPEVFAGSRYAVDADLESDEFDLQAGGPEPEPPPQAGEEVWGRWRHGAEGIELQLELAATPDGPARAKSMRCEPTATDTSS